MIPDKAIPPDRDELILEGIVVTQDAEGQANIAPMGPLVDRAVSRIVLRPFPTAQTYQNLVRTYCGVFHVTDDVELIARAAVGRFSMLPPMLSVPEFPCPRLADTCRWFAFRVQSIDDSQPRVEIDCNVVQYGDVRSFFGFNRSKHAVLEAAILATRIGILAPDEIQREMDRLAVPVQKTAGQQERRAFEFLKDHIAQSLNLTPDP